MGWISDLPKPAPLDEMVADYVELVAKGERDRLNRLVHPVWGPSSHMLWLMQTTYGVGEVSKALDKEFTRNENQSKEVGYR